jgi:hypothetical protein
VVVCANVNAGNRMFLDRKPTAHRVQCGILNSCYRRERADNLYFWPLTYALNPCIHEGALKSCYTYPLIDPISKAPVKRQDFGGKRRLRRLSGAS